MPLLKHNDLLQKWETPRGNQIERSSNAGAVSQEGAVSLGMKNGQNNKNFTFYYLTMNLKGYTIEGVIEL
jgi:hypothetical protein